MPGGVKRAIPLMCFSYGEYIYDQDDYKEMKGPHIVYIA